MTKPAAPPAPPNADSLEQPSALKTVETVSSVSAEMVPGKVKVRVFDQGGNPLEQVSSRDDGSVIDVIVKTK